MGFANSIAKEFFDVIIVGAGISGSLMARGLTARGMRCLLVEAGKSFAPGKYPTNEMDANSQLYWSGGIEFNTTADLGFLRPKCVGGGSIVNQALVDRFDDIALDSWKEKSEVSFFTKEGMAPWYEKAESYVAIQTIPEEYRNGNARIFQEGFQKNGFRHALLRRAQNDCKYEEGNDCVECLAGCPLQSKQSTPWTSLARAQETGLLQMLPNFEVNRFSENSSGADIFGTTTGGLPVHLRGKHLVLSAGAIGNTKILFQSGYGKSLPALGSGFYSHPQYMNLALYDQPVNAHKGPFQTYKSDDPHFRKNGFKLENVFAPPIAISMLLPGIGRSHQELMEKITHFACIEVAVRDTNPGRIRIAKSGKVIIEKFLNSEDKKRQEAGLKAVNQIFQSTGAKKIIPGQLGIGLHLMGGCSIGVNVKNSVVNSDFKIHGTKFIYAADSSIFPNAPGINPSLTIMALATMASQSIGLT